MKSRLPKWYYIIPVLYVALIFGFIHLHLNETGGRTVTRSLGSVTVRYRQENGVRRGISRLTLEVGELRADLSEGVQVQDSGGRNDRVPVDAVSLENGRLILRLVRGGSIEFAEGFSVGGGVRFSAVSEKESEEGAEEGAGEAFGTEGEDGFAVVFRTAEDRPADFFPILSFDATGVVETVYEGMPLLRFGPEDGEDGATLIVHESSEVSEEGQFVLRFDGPGRPGIFREVERAFSGDGESGGSGLLYTGMVAATVSAEYSGDLLGYWFFGRDEAVSAEATADSVEQRVEEKIGQMAETWRGGGEAGEEKVLSALAAYSMEQSGRPGLEGLANMRSAAQGGDLFTVAPFVGNIVTAERNYSGDQEQSLLEPAKRTDREGVMRLFSEMAKGTSYPSLPGALVFAGEDENLRQLAETGGQLLGAELRDSAARAGIFIFAMEILDSYPDRYGEAADLAGKGYRYILPYMVKIGSQLMYRIVTGDENNGAGVFAVDPVVQIKLARALQGYGELENDRTALQLGSLLLESVLSFADENGALPTEISLDAGILRGREPRLAPELFYPYLSTNNYYPRVVSLRKELGRDLRVWTAAQGVGAVQRADGYEITFDFAAGQTEYLVIRGVEPFTSLNLYGLQWNGDFRFQNYDVGGWYYDREQGKLYMKIRHAEKVERIRIFE